MLREDRERRVKMDSEMEQLRQAAFLAEVAYERKQEAKQRKKAAEETARKKKARPRNHYAIATLFICWAIK